MKLGVRQVYLHVQPCTTGCSPSVSSHTAQVLLGVRQVYLHTHSPCTRICTTSLEQLRYLKVLSMKCCLFRRAVGSTALDVSKALRRTLEAAVNTYPMKRCNQQYLNLRQHPSDFAVIIQGVSKRALQIWKLIEIYTEDIHKVFNCQNVAKHTEFYLG
jgi:hypothetical protein